MTFSLIAHSVINSSTVSRPVHLQIINTWFMPCSGAPGYLTQYLGLGHTPIPIPRSDRAASAVRSNKSDLRRWVPLSTACRAYPYPHPQHRIDGMDLKGLQLHNLLLGRGQNEIHIMRETPRVQLRLNSQLSQLIIAWDHHSEWHLTLNKPCIQDQLEADMDYS